MGFFDRFKGKQNQGVGGIEQAKEEIEAAQTALGEKLRTAMEEKYGEGFKVLECGLGSPMQPYGMATMKSESHPDDVIQVFHTPKNKAIPIQDNYAKVLVAEDFRRIAQKIVDRKIQPNIVKASITGLTLPPELGVGATWEQYLAVKEKPLVNVYIYVDIPDEERREGKVKEIAEAFIEEGIACMIRIRFYKDRRKKVDPERKLTLEKWYPHCATVYMNSPKQNEKLRINRITFSDVTNSANCREIHYGDRDDG